MNIDANLKKELKSQGYLPSRDGEHVAVRVITGNGVLSTEQLQVVSDVAKTYGRNEVTFTTRLTVEIPWIKYEDVDAVKEIFAKKQYRHRRYGQKGKTFGKLQRYLLCIRIVGYTSIYSKIA